MNNFNFGEILTRAWKIIWKHKVLWIFGILASCGRSSGNFNSSRGGGGNGGGGGNLPPQVLQWFNWIEAHAVAFIAIFITVLCIIWIIVAFLSTIGKIGLIRGVQQAEAGAESLIFGQLFSESMPYFWRMFGLSVILAIPGLIFVIIFVGAAILIIIPASQSGNSSAAAGSILALIPLLIGCLCFFVLLMFVLRLFFTQAERAIVLEDLGVMPALSHGWEVFRKNLGPVIIMAIILGVVSFVVGLVTVIPILLIVVPAAFAFAIGNARNGTPLIFAAVCFCLYLPVLWVLSGILISYVETAWTLTYMSLTGQQPGNLGGSVIENPPAPEPPADSNKTMLAGSSNVDVPPAAPVSDPNKTVIGRAPSAEPTSQPDDNPPSEADDPNKTVLRRPPHA